MRPWRCLLYTSEYVPKPVKIDASEPLKITVEDNTYIVEGKWLERLMSNINFGDYELSLIHI